MRVVAAVGATVLAALVASAPSAQAADECRGLMVCIPVAGPWVVIPAPSQAARYPEASWRLRCPRGSIVGGVDARLSRRTIDVTFTGLPGSPVNPGITTTNEVVFRGIYTGKARRPTTFRPFIGCIPTTGGGRIPTQQTVSVEVPAGVSDGMDLRIEGGGEDGRGGGPSGDLYLTLAVRPHRVFDRRGQDLVCLLELPMTAAALGAEVEVETLDGPATLTVPPGTRAGSVLRLRGKGLPHVGRRGRGDLLLRVDLDVPLRLARKERELLESLADLRDERSRPLRGRLRPGT